MLFAMIKPFLHRNDVEKIKILSTDKNEWTSALLEEIDDGELYSYYGGSQTDPDGNPKCPSKVYHTILNCLLKHWIKHIE